MKTKVAIACQGGGCQTAFTAGVLKRSATPFCRTNRVREHQRNLRRRALCSARLVRAVQGGDADMEPADRVLALQHRAEPAEQMINDK